MNVKFSPEITVGHILQALTVMVTVGGGAIVSYVSLRADIAKLAESMAMRSAAIEVRVSVLESRRQTDESFQAETRVSLNHMMAALSDLKVQLAKGRP